MDYSLGTDFKVLDGMMAGLKLSKDKKKNSNKFNKTMNNIPKVRF